MSVLTPSSSGEPQDPLLDAIEFSRGMGNYFFLPIFLVFGFCVVLLLFGAGSGSISLLHSRIFLVYAALTGMGFGFWRASRRPRATLLIIQAVILMVLDVVWVGWILFTPSTSLSPSRDLLGWAGGVWGVMWALTVFVGLGSASIKCFQVSRLVRNMPFEKRVVRIRRTHNK